MSVGVAAKIQYAVGQSLRVSQFLSQAIIGGLALGRKPDAEQLAKMPARADILKDLKNLFERDFQNIEAGIYKMPDDDLASPIVYSRNSMRFFLDLFKVRKRQQSNNVVEASQTEVAADFPKYFTQNFHFQTDGYLSEKSADLYDHQVEIVFAGGADAMRRQALVPLHAYLQESGNEKAELLDIACGTGRFLREVKRNFPKMRVTGVDLSPWYLKRARDVLSHETHVNFVEANAENLPFKDAQFDVVTCIFLFHELPRRVREIVSAEMVRVLKPGGKLIFIDSIQKGDKPQFDASLDFFPVNYHEPYYLDYIKDDLAGMFGRLGLVETSTDLAFFSKVLSFTKAASRVKRARSKKAKVAAGTDDSETVVL